MTFYQCLKNSKAKSNFLWFHSFRCNNPRITCDVVISKPKYKSRLLQLKLDRKLAQLELPHFDFSTKMEIWDPFTGNIHHTTDKLPQQGSQTTAFFFQIVSMNANTELLFVGGTFSSLPIISDVWKFRYSSGVWTNVGKLHYPIREHTSFLVYNLSCT